MLFIGKQLARKQQTIHSEDGGRDNFRGRDKSF